MAMKNQSPFTYRAERMELSYEASFGTPAFDLPSKNVQLLRALYEAINPRFPVNITGMQAQGGNSLGDVKVRAFLLNNHAVLDIDVQRFLFATLVSITTKDDLGTLKDCLLLAQDAWKSIFPDISFVEGRFELRLHLSLDGGRDSVSTIIRNLTGSHHPIDLGASYQGMGLSMNYENQEEMWRASFTIDESQIVPSGFYIYGRATYFCDGAFNSFHAQEAHLSEIVDKLFRGLNLHVAAD